MASAVFSDRSCFLTVTSASSVAGANNESIKAERSLVPEHKVNGTHPWHCGRMRKPLPASVRRVNNAPSLISAPQRAHKTNRNAR